MDAIYNVLGVKSSFSMAFFSLNYVMMNTNNKIRNENAASTGSLAGSKRFFLHSVCLARALTKEPAATRFSTKKVERWSTACRKPDRKPGFRPGLQLNSIMEYGPKTAVITRTVRERKLIQERRAKQID